MPSLPSTLLSRRRFLAALLQASAGTAIAPLALAHARYEGIDADECLPGAAPGTGFGRPVPQLAQNALDLTETIVGDLSQTPLLDVPPGFLYRVLSVTGDAMSDGGLVPGDPDGMACFRVARGRYALVRNHELSPGENAFGNRAGVQPTSGLRYDPFRLPAGQAGGGTTTLIVDWNGRLVEQVASLGGTSRNCAGGPTPWNSWISCEEDTRIPFLDGSVAKRHGYCFEVPVALEAVDPEPIVGAGRFNHEAAAVDRATGILYETEDRADGCFYRYVSHRRPSRYGHLQAGGSLYAMAIDAGSTAACDGTPIPTLTQAGGVHAVDTRGGVRSFLGQPLRVHWIPIDDVDPAFDTLRFEARSKGASLIARGEGAWYDRGKVYFVSTSGGDVGCGQIWAYDARRETLTLVFESPGAALLDNPDNIAVARDGTLYVCEDGSGEQFVVGLDRRGEIFPLLRNAFDDGEFAGVCFSPDGRMLFVNSQGLGISFAVHREGRRPLFVPHRRRGHDRRRHAARQWGRRR